MTERFKMFITQWALRYAKDYSAPDGATYAMLINWLTIWERERPSYIVLAVPYHPLSFVAFRTPINVEYTAETIPFDVQWWKK